MPTAVFTQLPWHPSVDSVEATFAEYAPRSPKGAYPALGNVPLEELRKYWWEPISGEKRDEVIHEFLTAAQAGDALAQLALIKLLVPKAIKVVASSRQLRLYSMDDAMGIYITALWEAILTHPLARRKSLIFSLAMEALGIVNGHVKSSRRPVECPLEDWHDTAAEQQLQSASNRTEEDLAEVLAWSLSAGVLTRDEVVLLTRYYLAGDIPNSRQDLMEDHALSAEALRKKASRIRSKLVEAVRTEITEAGW